MKCNTETVWQGCCGVGVFCDFDSEWGIEDLETAPSRGGTEYSIAGFVNTQTCKKAYEILKGRFNIVFQSPVRRNLNSGRDFFFCVYKER